MQIFWNFPTAAYVPCELQRGNVADALDCHPFDLLDAPPQAKSERERALLELFSGMSDEQQDAFFQATAALAQPVSREEGDEKKRA